MKQDHSPVLPGDGATDYARYMRLNTLLALQRRPDEMMHRDELLFQVVHQSTELWLKLIAAELAEAVTRLRVGELAVTESLLTRATLGIRLVTDQLEMFRHLSPADFQAMQPALGKGSGAESPGWRQVHAMSRQLGRAFAEHLEVRGIEPAALGRPDPADPVQRLAEALIEWDERVSLWRMRHYRVALRVGGHDPGGAEATMLAKFVGHRFFPALWRARLKPSDGSANESQADQR
ncbi:tryptophan 23-dioxygenase [Micromonospora sp. L5]|uniref:tryptophan 2,3-dioxygenase family protein n=1 Tax=Micromonospora sp. (strain L5) TaxID=648999 RepID=UPI0001EFAC09|nr:tryptophan 2,3-dioxygenase family protein [Micromonospora sp. L5]ADU09769.1 tryptophan 23-dioxygenase [Micromonospora sp. L5]